jgi:hypothetical protein
VPSALAARRLELLALARAAGPGFLRVTPDALRFSLGTSLADLAIPVAIAPDADAIVRGAAVELALLLGTHHRGFVPADDVDRLALREGAAALPPVPARLGPAGGGPDLRAAAQLAHGVHPVLTGGAVAAWMGKGGRGRSLVALFIELLRRALAEREAAGGREDTPALVALALARACADSAGALGDALPRPPLDRPFRAAVQAGLWLAARTGLARAWREAGGAADDPALAALEAALGPPAFLGGRAGLVGYGATLYGCDLGPGVPRADELAGELAVGGEPGAAREAVLSALAADADLGRRAEASAALARLRDLLAAAAAAGEAAGHEDALGPLRDACCAPGALAAAAADGAARGDLAGRLRGAARGGPAGSLLERAAAVLSAWKPREPGAAVGLAPEAARRAYAEAALGLLADLALERLAAPARAALSFRTGREAEGGAEAEYAAGRLYRLSARGGPILERATDAQVGHLFADVKDFTRRTALLGQAAMAEFLRLEFYLPLVVAAKEHFGGMQHLADRGGVSLNNLLGDAVSFSGRIGAMVALARAIRTRFAAYAARLQREISSEVVARQIDAIEAQQGTALAAARAARADAEAQAARHPPGSPERAAWGARAARAAAEAARIEEERARALARARGEVLEAGVFISHGPAPVVVVIEDEVFGRNRVAIADRINESARGTARAPAARTAADAGLARERARRGAPGVAHAFSVFIGQPLPLAAPADLEEEALRLWRAGDGPGAMRALAAPVRDALEAAARATGERPGDVYNSGAALSEEALGAFLAEAEGERHVRRLTLAPAEIPEALRARFWYGDAPLALVACFERDGRPAELFRRVGRAAFKGLGGVTVWELCGEDGGAAELFRALGPGWLRGPAQSQ